MPVTDSLSMRWEFAPLRRLLRGIDQGWSPTAEDRTTEPDEWAVLKLSSVSRGTFRPDEHKALPAELDPVRRLEVRQGDLLLTRANTPELVGDVCVVPEVRPNLMMSDLIYRLRLDTDRLDPRFMQYWLLSSPGRDQIARDARGSSQSMVKISQQTVRSWLIPVPSLEEQRAIAGYLDEKTAAIDALIAKRERHVELLEEERQAALARVMTSGVAQPVSVKASGLDWLGEIPSHWTVTRLRHVVPEITVGIVVTPSRYYVEHGVPCLRSLNVRPNALAEEDLAFISPESNTVHRKSIIRYGDLVAVRTGNPGTTAVVDERFDGGNAIDLIIIRRSPAFDSHFLSYFMNSSLARHQFAAGSEGALQLHFNVETAKDLLIPLPPLEEQRRIAAHLSDVNLRRDELVRAIQTQIDKLWEYRQTLISAAVTGQAPVREEIPA
ncbi:MAG TPA: restriction endonuclease subunit S [Longimicrobiaceae bacterium]|nr:restriction endonuclease subunit S [Longimicrobiaceae bacterium]